MSDGGEGLLDALGGQSRHTTVSGPLGRSVDAEWRLLPDHPDPPAEPAATAGPLTAVIEMSKASGRALVPRPERRPRQRRHDRRRSAPPRRTRRGARRIVVGCGGSATTDGGWGAFAAVSATAPDAPPTQPLGDIELVVACDVTTLFLQAATVFGPQKGATEEQVVRLTTRLDEIAATYRTLANVDVTTIPGAGAAGGLAGGLVALGARIEPGFELVARIVHLAERLEQADLVITGEGHVDPPSFEGKVPGGVLQLAQARTAPAAPAPKPTPTPSRTPSPSSASAAAPTPPSWPTPRPASRSSASPPSTAANGPATTPSGSSPR